MVLLKWLKRLLLWAISVVLATTGFFISQDVFRLFFNDTLSMLLSATVVGLVTARVQRDVETDEKDGGSQ